MRAGLADLQPIADFVRATCGLVIDPARRDVLLGLVTLRCEIVGASGPAEYLARIHSDQQELQQLIEGLTVGETYFARLPPQMRALNELVLPSLLARGDRRVRIWCAGCSTGEEAYTVAMSLAKLLPTQATKWDIRIIATDINLQALQSAKEGCYGSRSVALLSDDELRRFFTRDGDRWRVGEELRALVEFRHHNLASAAPPAARLDLILCRNVLIYFDRDAMRGAVEKMYGALAPGGWLLLGHSETLWRLYDGFELVRHHDAFLYRRRPPSPAVVRRPPPLRWPISQPIASPAAPSAQHPPDEVREALAAGAYSEAAELSARQAAADPLDATAHYLHGLALVETGNDEQALPALRRASYLQPQSGFAQFLLAVVLGRLGHAAESRRAYGAAAQALAQRAPDERASELGDRRVADLATMCWQLAFGAPSPRPAPSR